MGQTVRGRQAAAGGAEAAETAVVGVPEGVAVRQLHL